MPRSVFGWTPESVRAAIHAQTNGDFSQVGALSRAMGMDSAYTAAVDKRSWSLIRSKTEVNQALCDDRDAPIADRIRDGVEYIWYHSCEDSVLQKIFRSYLETGVGVGFIEWEMREGYYFPDIKYLPPDHLRYDSMTREWTYSFEDSFNHRVTPGDGNWVLLTQWTPGSAEGFVTSLGSNWLIKQYSLKDWIDGNSSYIDPIAIVSEDENAAHTDEEDLDLLINEIQLQKRDRVLYMPQGHKVEFALENPSYNPEAFRGLIEYTDRKYQVSILGGNLSSEVTSSGGNRAASQTHAGIEQEIARTDAATLSHLLESQVFPYITDFNFGFKELSPRIDWIIESGEDKASMASALSTALGILKEHFPDKIVTNIDSLMEQFGLELADAQSE